GGEVRRAAQGRPGLEAAKHDRRRRREGRKALQAHGTVERARRRPERLRELRGVRRADEQDERVSFFPSPSSGRGEWGRFLTLALLADAALPEGGEGKLVDPMRLAPAALSRRGWADRFASLASIPGSAVPAGA